jgi:hypothetical protein
VVATDFEAFAFLRKRFFLLTNEALDHVDSKARKPHADQQYQSKYRTHCHTSILFVSRAYWVARM